MKAPNDLRVGKIHISRAIELEGQVIDSIMQNLRRENLCTTGRAVAEAALDRSQRRLNSYEIHKRDGRMWWMAEGAQA